MALITCPECGGSVSSLATSCPHCGCPLPASKPESQTTTLSMRTIGYILMILIGITVLVMKVVQVSSDPSDLSLAFHEALFTMMMLYFVIHFFTETFKTGEIAHQVVAFMGFGLATYITVINLIGYEGGYLSESIRDSYRYIDMAFGFLLILYAGTLANWSKYVFLTAGVLNVVLRSTSMVGNYMYWDRMFSDDAIFIIAIFCGLSLLVMFVSWITEFSKSSDNVFYRIIACYGMVATLAAIVVTIIAIVDITNGNVPPIKPWFIFSLIASMSSLLFYLPFRRNAVLYVSSAIYATLSLYLLMPLYMSVEGSYSTYEHIENIWKAMGFFYPMSIMMYYVAQAIQPYTSRISIKVD